jgi:class 3 adenylate cyclase
MAGAGESGLGSSIEATLREEAARNELTIAYARVFALTLTTALEWFSALAPVQSLGFAKVPASHPAIVTAYLALSVAIVAYLCARPGSKSLPFILPVFDGAFLVGEHLFAWRLLSHTTYGPAAMSASYAMSCALLASVGALRLERRATLWAAGIALVTFLAGVLLTTPEGGGEAVFAGAILVAIAFFSFRMTSLVRRAVTSEIAKVTLRRFVSKHVLDAAHHDPLSLLQQPRAVDASILVSDIRGFTQLCERLTPEEVLSFLNDVQGAFAAEVEANGGIVDKFIGDGMLAVFGAPTPLPNHAAHAIAAARGLQRVLAGINTRRETEGQAKIRIGIGVHSGPVVCGCLGGGDRLEFTVLGDTVNTASRLEGITKEIGVDLVVSDDAARRVPDSGLTRWGEVAIRGRTTPMEIHTMPGEQTARGTSSNAE